MGDIATAEILDFLRRLGERWQSLLRRELRWKMACER